MKRLREKVFHSIRVGDNQGLVSLLFNGLIVVLILVNLVIVFAETFPVDPVERSWLDAIDMLCIIVFSIEYALRVWTADFLYSNLSPAKARLKYIFSFMSLIDLVAILPFYLPFLLPIDLKVLRTLRLIRLLRLVKLKRYLDALISIGAVFRKKASQLIASMLVLVVLMLIASTLMYNVENAAQPDKFRNALDSMWWAVATITTVGYGDVYPVTAMGKVLGSAIALLGIALIAVPTGIISSGFFELMKKEQQESKHYCPHCGKSLD